MKNCIRLVLLILLPVSFSLLACGNNEGQNLILKANNEWIKGKNHSAVEQFKAILKKYPSDQFAEEALFRLGEIFHFSLNNSKQAITYFQEVKKLNKGECLASMLKSILRRLWNLLLKIMIRPLLNTSI